MWSVSAMHAWLHVRVYMGAEILTNHRQLFEFLPYVGRESVCVGETEGL